VALDVVVSAVVELLVMMVSDVSLDDVVVERRLITEVIVVERLLTTRVVVVGRLLIKVVVDVFDVPVLVEDVLVTVLVEVRVVVVVVVIVTVSVGVVVVLVEVEVVTVVVVIVRVTVRVVVGKYSLKSMCRLEHVAPDGAWKVGGGGSPASAQHLKY
jgi:hypothetical protein